MGGFSFLATGGVRLQMRGLRSIGGDSAWLLDSLYWYNGRGSGL